ncbi:cytochrome c oxidase assembly protein [Phenylobacterium sp.]|uniref:cytochrome c oxidase assembly protein n=1 Tax=Phenylobacterium sp. TaxID=1871053 RepID=UPI0027323CD8|nr:cytochrome c oxidase assembly protein [Phenylobacterium sp.]MDP3658847.1 cytochrome c oxidase assembly protein [Phenylobacterium sp.]
MSSTVRSEAPGRSPEERRNRRVAIICASGFVLMLGAAFAAVPLYKAFCQVTGFDGTVRRADAAPDTVLARKLEIRFDANVRELPWSFSAEQASQTVRIGETGLAFFKVTNHAKTPITGRAVYNVVPEQAAAYFQKLECFCFSDQTLQPGQTIEFPVVYFVDPKYADDFETKGKEQVTLSYTFYPAVDAAPGAKPITVSALGEKARAGL